MNHKKSTLKQAVMKESAKKANFQQGADPAVDQMKVNQQLQKAFNCLFENLENFSTEWSNVIQSNNEKINKEIHDCLKYSSDHKRKIDSTKSNKDERNRKIETLVNIKNQFNLSSVPMKNK